MLLAESLFVGLDPYVDKKQLRFLLRENVRDYIQVENYDCNIIKDLFLKNSHIKTTSENIKDEIFQIAKLEDDWNGQGTKKLSADVINNSLAVANFIPPSLLYNLHPSNIYPSKFGTIILDWEFGTKENLFSLEIAKKSLGYFIEKDGKDIKQVESLSLDEDSFDQTISSIINDLGIFF